MSATDHDRYEDDAGAYVLGALTELEAQAFERHLAGCSECQGEVERLRFAAEALPRSVQQFAAPATLKSALMEAVEGDARSSTTARRRGLAALVPRLPRLGAGLRPSLAAAALLLIVGMLAGYAFKAADEDGGGEVVAAEVDRSRVPDGSASLVVPEEDEGAVLRVAGMPSPGHTRVYKVWLKRGDEVAGSSLFSVGPDGRGAAAIPEDLGDVDAVLVTRERPAAVAPTEDPVITVDV